MLNKSGRNGVLMARRVTVILDDDLIKKIRAIQAKAIIQHEYSVSFSRTVNELLRKEFK